MIFPSNKSYLIGNGSPDKILSPKIAHLSDIFAQQAYDTIKNLDEEKLRGNGIANAYSYIYQITGTYESFLNNFFMFLSFLQILGHELAKYYTKLDLTQKYIVAQILLGQQYSETNNQTYNNQQFTSARGLRNTCLHYTLPYSELQATSTDELISLLNQQNVSSNNSQKLESSKEFSMKTLIKAAKDIEYLCEDIIQKMNKMGSEPTFPFNTKNGKVNCGERFASMENWNKTKNTLKQIQKIKASK